MKYYSLTFRTPCDGHTVGSRLLNAENVIYIGQQESADIRIPCSPSMLPQAFAVIVPNEDGESWRLVKQTDFYEIRVNGTAMNYVHALESGDMIEFEGSQPLKLRFMLHDDTSYDVAGNIAFQKRLFSPLGMAVVLVLLVALIVGVVTGKQKYDTYMSDFTKADTTDIKESVYMITVDCIMLQMHAPGYASGVYETVDTTEPNEYTHGTCFFTQDSLCITARHCVEPWITFNWHEYNENTRVLPKEVEWVLKAETSMVNQTDTIYRVVTKCSVLDGDSCIYTFLSSGCSFNRSRDNIFRMGSEGLVWRNCVPFYNRLDMELGDFAFIKADRAGELQLADLDYMDPWDFRTLKKMIAGFPKLNNIDFMTKTVGGITLPRLDEQGVPISAMLLSVGVPAGYSGSPVIVKRGGDLYVVGILSKADDFDKDQTSYAVPSTEITDYNPEKANEQTRYRR